MLAGKLIMENPGAFLANLDTSFVIATYSSISSEFNQASRGPWILIAYNLGYSVLLPVVSVDRLNRLPSSCLGYLCVFEPLG